MIGHSDQLDVRLASVGAVGPLVAAGSDDGSGGGEGELAAAAFVAMSTQVPLLVSLGAYEADEYWGFSTLKRDYRHLPWERSLLTCLGVSNTVLRLLPDSATVVRLRPCPCAQTAQPKSRMRPQSGGADGVDGWIEGGEGRGGAFSGRSPRWTDLDH